MADPAPRAVNVHLQPCCKAAIQRIRDKHEAGEDLLTLLGSSPLLVIVGSGPIDAAFSLTTTDWDLWGRAMRSVSPIVRSACRKEAAFELLKHQKDRSLREFWDGVYRGTNMKAVTAEPEPEPDPEQEKSLLNWIFGG